MITVWGMPIMASVGQILLAVQSEVLGDGLMRQIRDVGTNYMVTCTEHKNGMEHSPSMGIRKEEYINFRGKKVEAGAVHCFTCGYQADLPTWIAHVLGLGDSVAGMRWLMLRFSYAVGGERAEIPLSLEREIAPLKYIDQLVVDAYAKNLEEFDGVKEYLKTQRHLTDETIRLFSLGASEEGNVTIPIYMEGGECLFIKERSIYQKKYLNSMGVEKGQTLYGVHLLNRGEKEIWVCEGEFDCMSLWQRGKRAVSLMGSSINEHQAKMLMRYSGGKIIAALDNDKAGWAGTRRLKDMLLPMGGRVFTVKYGDVQGDWNSMSDSDMEKITLI
jgi:hypothetical protein